MSSTPSSSDNHHFPSPASPLIGVTLCSETEKNSSTYHEVMATLYVPQETRSVTTLKEIRQELLDNHTLPFLGQRRFIFLTANHWEINEDLEDRLKLSHILTSDGRVNIRLVHEKPRVGIVIEGIPDTPMGFIFCNMSSKVEELLDEISDQLPGLYGSLCTKQFCFLDRNAWPLDHSQEKFLTVRDIATSHTIKIRCSRATSYARNNSMVMEDPERTRISISDSLPLPSSLHGNRESALSPVNELAESDQKWPSSDYADTFAPGTGLGSFEILLSYVHTEAGPYALLLKNALEELGYSVFLDIHCIEGGKDWQDILNEAITNCSLFVPLITLQYGKTLWTNREVKLADVLGKLILPVNFEKTWPPKCLAIQFATTQYISGNKSATEEVMPDKFQESEASMIATEIADRYQRELLSLSPMKTVNKLVRTGTIVSDSDDTSKLSRQSTEILEDSSEPSSPGGLKVLNFSRRKSALKSYASNLPESIPQEYREAVCESRAGKPLIVISCSEKQQEFAHKELVPKIEAENYEVWCSSDVSNHPDEEKLPTFQEKVNEAGAVVFVLSKDFSEDTFCEQQVYYCEQRKRIIPLIYQPIEMPNWMATLIGTSAFVSCQSQNYMSHLIERISSALNPKKAEDELRDIIRQKTELANLCTELDNKLPKGSHVYVSGGTLFYSKCGEAITKEIGKQLAALDGIILVTGGFYGVGETMGRSFFEERERLGKPHNTCHIVAVSDKQDKSKQTRQNPDGTFKPVPYGDTLFTGNSVRQREMLTPRVVDLCILIEGGPGAAFEAQQFVWNGHHVIPIRVTGGAAGGSFNIPSSILARPPSVPESDWSILGDVKASPADIAAAVVRIMKVLKKHDISSLVPILRQRSNTGGMKKREGPLAASTLVKFKRSKVVRKGESIPKRSASIDILQDDSTTETRVGVKRALSEKVRININ